MAVFCERCIAVPRGVILKCPSCKRHQPGLLSQVCDELDAYLINAFPLEYDVQANRMPARKNKHVHSKLLQYPVLVRSFCKILHQVLSRPAMVLFESTYVACFCGRVWKYAPRSKNGFEYLHLETSTTSGHKHSPRL